MSSFSFPALSFDLRTTSMTSLAFIFTSETLLAMLVVLVAPSLAALLTLSITSITFFTDSESS